MPNGTDMSGFSSTDRLRTEPLPFSEPAHLTDGSAVVTGGDGGAMSKVVDELSRIGFCAVNFFAPIG